MGMHDFYRNWPIKPSVYAGINCCHSTSSQTPLKQIAIINQFTS
jgi:hypothetical protein